MQLCKSPTTLELQGAQMLYSVNCLEILCWHSLKTIGSSFLKELLAHAGSGVVYNSATGWKLQLLTRGNLNISQKLQTDLHVLANVSDGQPPYCCMLNIDCTIVFQAAF